MNAAISPDPSISDEAHQPLIGLPTLMKMAFSGADMMPLGTRLLQRAEHHADDANTLMDLSTILQLRGQRDVALAMQGEALGMQRLYHLPAATGEPAIRLLAIMGPGDLMANTPLEFLVEETDVSLDMLYVDAFQPFPATVPDHDVAFVAVAESDENHPLLHHIAHAMQAWPRPVLNRAERIARLTRDGVCAMLQSAAGIVAPATVRVQRTVLEQLGHGPLAGVLEGCDFPLIVRPVGSHAGHGLMKLQSPAAVADYLAALPDSEFYLAPFVDYAGPDGLYRKYRIVLVDGRPYAGHMAISRRWMVHYLNADMLENGENRDLEASFMAGFEEDFARRHAAAFRTIHERTGLDYIVIDCGETRAGELLIFEVDTSAVVHAMDPVDIFPYKQPEMRKVFDAFRDMLARAALRSDSTRRGR